MTVRYLEGVWKLPVHVIASEAKQSVVGKEIALSPTAPRNDTSSPLSKHPLDRGILTRP